MLLWLMSVQWQIQRLNRTFPYTPPFPSLHIDHRPPQHHTMESTQSDTNTPFAINFPPELLKAVREDPKKYYPTLVNFVKDAKKNIENAMNPDKAGVHSRYITGKRREDIPDSLPPLQKEVMMEELASLRNKFANRLLLGHNVLMKYRHTVNSVEREYSTEPVSQLEPSTFYSFRLWGVTSKLIQFSCLRCLSRKGSWCVVITPSLCWS